MPDWFARRLGLKISLSKLSVSRPATIDLVLTKMARGDDEDLGDIRFILSQEPISADELRKAFEHARVPAVPEIQDLFLATQPKVLQLAATLSRQ